MPKECNEGLYRTLIEIGTMGYTVRIHVGWRDNGTIGGVPVSTETGREKTHKIGWGRTDGVVRPSTHPLRSSL